MNRRNFIALATLGILSPIRKLAAEHHVTSVNPMMVDFDLATLQGRYTAVEDFYVRDHGDVPQDQGTLSLQIEGEVRRPQRLMPESFEALPKHELGAVIECAGNLVGTVAKVSNGVWKGWSLGDVLSLTGPVRAGAHLHLYGRDGYARSVPADRAYNDGMLATHLNGRPLGRYHGAPWRALFPGWYGMDSVKWLERIVVAETPLPPRGNEYLEVTAGPSGGLTPRPLPRVQVKSVILSPAGGAVLRRGAIEVRGLAWSGEARPGKVEVSADGGTSWRRATLDLGSRYEWAWWRSELELSRRGAVEFVCRATDEKGSTQPAERDPKRLDGYANNWCHRIHCVVV